MALKQTLGRVLQLASGQFLPVWKSCVGFSDSQDSIRNLSEVIQRLLSPSIGCWKRQAQWEDRRKASNPIFVLGEDQQTAFTELIDCLTSAPVLGYADYSKPFDLHVDVSADGLGSVLCQWQCDQQRILTFASRGPCVSESRYPAHKLEFLCLKWVVSEKFKDYGGGEWIRLIVGFQPFMVISPTASWIRWCMQVYAWWLNVDLSCFGRTIYAVQFWGAKPPIQFCHRWAKDYGHQFTVDTDNNPMAYVLTIE